MNDQGHSSIGLSHWLSVGSALPLEYSEQIQAMQSGEALSNRDYVLRNVLTLICCATLVYATGNPFYLAWGLAYGAVNTAYTVTLLRMKPPIGRSKYATICVLHVLGNLVYASLPITLWVTESDPALLAIATFALAGAIMQNLTRKNLLIWTSIADGLNVILITGVISTMLILSMETVAQKAVIAVGSTAIIVYFVHSLLDSTRAMVAQHNSRKEAVELQKSNAISQITAGVAHDFNNILTAVQGFVELADLETDPRERAELLQQAHRSTRQAIDIVSKMTAYVERSQISPVVIDIDRYFESPRAVLEVLAPEQIRVSVDKPEAGMSVYADRVHLDTALINLAQNAIEAMSDTSGSLQLRITRTTAEDWPEAQLSTRHAYVAFSFRDTGPGIHQDVITRVTEPFFTTKLKAGGSGLGLSMVKGFARQSGGGLVLRNHPEGGLDAHLILPVAPSSNRR